MERMVSLSLLVIGLSSGAGVAAGHGIAAIGPAVLAVLGCIVLRSTRA